MMEDSKELLIACLNEAFWTHLDKSRAAATFEQGQAEIIHAARLKATIDQLEAEVVHVAA